MSIDWLHGDDESASNKRAFLLNHGSADHIRQIVGASKDPMNQTGRMSLAIVNPHCPPDVFEHAFKKPYLRAMVAKNANCPPHIHEQALKHESHEVRFAALSSDLATRAHMEAAKNDPVDMVRSVAHHRIGAANVGLRPLRNPLREQSDAFRDISTPRKSYLTFSAEIGTSECHENVAEIGAKQQLEEGRRDNFMARYGTQQDVESMVTSDSEDDRALQATTKNPLFSRAHHEAMLNHPDPMRRLYALDSKHTTPEDLKKARSDDSWYVRSRAEDIMNGVNVVKESKSYTGFLGSVGLKPMEESVGENHELYSTYTDSDNKRIYVPKTNIIAGASETNEGLATMANAMDVKLCEDTQGMEWKPGMMAHELQLSDAVHGHYADAGISHYPYTQPGRRTDYSRITTVHAYNFHSRGVNDFLHRNYHGLQKSWDAKHHDVVNKIDGIFADHTTKDPLNVVSGLKQSPQSIIDHARSQGHEVGEHIHLHLPAYTSTTTRAGTALAFAKIMGGGNEVGHGDQHLLHVHVPAGNRLIGLEMHPDLENGRESEIVMPRDTIVRVNTTPSVYRMGHRNIHVWMSHVVGSNPVPLKPLPNVKQ